MKKNFLVFTVILFFGFTFSSCQKENETTKVEAKVTQNGIVKAGTSVYMFKKQKGPDSDFFLPIFADKQTITGSDGIATFELKEVVDLEVNDSQTTLYFGVFKGETIIGQSAVTIKTGETKTIEIKL